jgi:hypothetical protein
MEETVETFLVVKMQTKLLKVNITHRTNEYKSLKIIIKIRTNISHDPNLNPPFVNLIKSLDNKFLFTPKLNNLIIVISKLLKIHILPFPKFYYPFPTFNQQSIVSSQMVLSKHIPPQPIKGQSEITMKTELPLF